jgi:iron complex transport system ATP-binding protein
LSKCSEVSAEGIVGGYSGGFKVGPLSFNVESGEILVVVGPNASGKTTLLRLISGILPLEKGSLSLCGYERERFLSMKPPQLSYVPSFPEADLMVTPEELIKASSGSLERAYQYVPQVREFAKRRLLHLSSGQRRLACIARGFSTDPKLLLIDEPLAHLDIASQELVLSSIKRFVKEGSIVIVTMHELHLAPLLADKILLLNKGKEVAFGSPEDVLKKELLEKVYGARLLEVLRGDRKIYLPRISL